MASGADALGQRMSAELAQVEAELAEGLVLLSESMPLQDSFMQLPGGPVAEQATGVQQAVEQAGDAVVMHFDAGNAARAGGERLSQFRQSSAIYRRVEELRLLCELPVGGGGQALLERR